MPSYYARDLLNKMQRCQQGSQSVEDYFQELQKGMIRCGILEDNDAAMARFRGGLNREIQDILDYKEYYDMTTLFEYACKAEREVQGRRSKQYSNPFAGRSSTSTSAPVPPAPSTLMKLRCPIFRRVEIIPIWRKMTLAIRLRRASPRRQCNR